MIDFLKEIKSVRGVSGVLFLDKKVKKSHQLLPSSFKPKIVKDLFVLILNLTEVMEGGGKIEFKYEDGKAYLFNFPSGALFVYGRLSLNLALLELLIKSFLLKVEKRKVGALPSGSLAFSDQFFVEVLIRTINRVSQGYKKILGTHLVTQNLRQAKESIIPDFPFLKGIFVDNNGEVSLLNGEKILGEKRTLEAFARWIFQLIKFCSVLSDGVKSLDIEELTSELKDDLEQIGFYRVYRSLGK